VFDSRPSFAYKFSFLTERDGRGPRVFETFDVDRFETFRSSMTEHEMARIMPRTFYSPIVVNFGERCLVYSDAIYEWRSKCNGEFFNFAGWRVELSTIFFYCVGTYALEV